MLAQSLGPTDYYCHDCKQWQPTEQYEDAEIYYCIVCGSDILCDNTGKIFGECACEMCR